MFYLMADGEDTINEVATMAAARACVAAFFENDPFSHLVVSCDITDVEGNILETIRNPAHPE